MAVGIPPTRAEIAPMSLSDGSGTRIGGRVTAGAHLASVAVRRVPKFDVGAGYVYEQVPRDLRMNEGKRASRDHHHGGYLEGSGRVFGGRHWRSSLGVKLSALSTPQSPNFGVAIRLDTELLGSGSGAQPVTSSCAAGVAAAHGTFGVGTYVEAERRVSTEGAAASMVTAGLSIRLPAMGFAGVVIPVRGC